MAQLGTLRKADLRECFPHEALDFTKWLAQPDNIAMLSAEIGVEMSVVGTEVDVGDFSVDILANEVNNTDVKVVIENQLEETDHRHLGQILTYASGIEARYIVWVVKSARQEHVKAINWLNLNTNDNINFFLVIVEAWRIDESLPAPKFMCIERPNDWVKRIAEAPELESLSDTKSRQYGFWKGFNAYVEERKLPISLRKPNPQHWYNLALGRSDLNFAITVNTKDNIMTAGIYIPDNKPVFEAFKIKEGEMTKAMSAHGKVNWYNSEQKKASEIYVERPFNLVDPPQTDITQAYDWIVQVYNTCREIVK